MRGYMRDTQRYKEKRKTADYENTVSGWDWSEIDHEHGMSNEKNTTWE